jgi:hypothetical protein
MRRLKQLEDENAKLQKVVADLSLDKEMLPSPRQHQRASTVGRPIACRLKLRGRLV